MPARRIMTADEIRRAIVRVSHEIVEKQGGTQGLVLVGIQRRGVPLAHRLAAAIEAHEAVSLEVGALDITFYRDDRDRLGPHPVVKGTDLPFPIEDATVVLVDDVLYTGRTVRAALDELTDFGRPRRISLCTLVDRGGRELPIQADIVGLVVKTGPGDRVDVLVEELDGRDQVDLIRGTPKEVSG